MDQAGTYIPRVIDGELESLLPELPAIAIEGAKGVGKTATGLRFARSVHDLDREADRSVIEAEPELVLQSEPPILIDEWQKVPETWSVIRRAIDQGAKPGSFLLTGSASPVVQGLHSGAGRIVSLRMRAMALSERLETSPTVSIAELMSGERSALEGQASIGLEDYAGEILRSGFPGVRAFAGRAQSLQLDSYISRVFERDFPELGYVPRNPVALRRWLTAYAAATATTASFEKLRDAASGGETEKLSKRASAPYRDILERLWIVDPVPGWKPTRNHISRLTEPPKHHLADPALAARLLGASRETLLGPASSGKRADGALLGALFESLVTQSIRVYAQPAGIRVGHLRSYAGEREVDLILERDDGRVVAIEVKLAATVKDEHVKSLRWLASQMGDDLLDAVVINTGPRAYRRPDGIGVVPAALLGC